MTVTHASASAAAPSQPGSFHDVPGWFYPTDIVLFDWFLSRQVRAGQRGDLLELGSYMGKSAVLIRAHLGEGEHFTVCDLFGSEAPEESNSREQNRSYATLTRRAFEENFLSFHDELPRILQAPTSVVPDEVAPGSCRFVHVDASHLYPHVRGDIAAARRALGPEGIVVLDDYRSNHTPGVACAAWQAVLEDGMRPVCVTEHKMFATWGDAGSVQDALHAELKERGRFWLQWQEVAGHRVLLVGGRKAALPPLPVSRHAAPAAPPAPPARPAPPRRGRRLRRVARDVLPPVLTRAIVRALARARKARGRRA